MGLFPGYVVVYLPGMSVKLFVADATLTAHGECSFAFSQLHRTISLYLIHWYTPVPSKYFTRIRPEASNKFSAWEDYGQILTTSHQSFRHWYSNRSWCKLRHMNVNYVPRCWFDSDPYQPISALAIRSIPEALSRYPTQCFHACSYRYNYMVPIVIHSIAYTIPQPWQFLCMLFVVSKSQLLHSNAHMVHMVDQEHNAWSKEGRWKANSLEVSSNSLVPWSKCCGLVTCCLTCKPTRDGTRVTASRTWSTYVLENHMFNKQSVYETIHCYSGCRNSEITLP